MAVEDLTQKTCEPCRGGIPPMEADRARDYLESTPGWELIDDAHKIKRRFSFDGFPAAIEFVQRVAEIAEREGHHPDLHIRYSDVDVVLYTHKIDGLHENDFIVAAKVNELAG